MKAIEIAYASAPADDPIIHSLQLINPDFDTGEFCLCSGFDDLDMGLESGKQKQFFAMGLGIQLPERSITGRMDLSFGIGNITGYIRQQMLKAKNGKHETQLIYRPYLASDLSFPANPPLRMTVVGYADDRQTATILASFRNLMDRRWPSVLFTPQKYPGVKYVS